MDNAEVLVAGAGPIGLTAAIELRRRGMSCRIIDPLTEPLRWSSVFRISHRIVDSYSRGTVFVAGDAAHIDPPTSAQGMNTGIQDAHILARRAGVPLDEFTDRLPAILGLSTGRFTAREEVAALVAFLASGRAANISGADLVIDGGMLETV